MLCDQTTHLWLGRFSVRLMQLREGLALPAAVRRAVAARAHSRAMLPEHAARIDAAVVGPGLSRCGPGLRPRADRTDSQPARAGR